MKRTLPSYFAFFPILIASWLLQGKVTDNISAPGEGPYVLYKGEQVFVHYIQEGRQVKSDSFSVTNRQEVRFQVATGNPGETFTVQLKARLQKEKSEFRKVPLQFAVSDMEGNLKSMLKLLQANKIIDSQLNWTFGEGHLVLTGDFFDRGTQVTELLWFIYALEEKAKMAGGYVHFVLGNHEIMNLNGDFRYVQPKYMEQAALLQTDYYSLFNEQAELGRWLRTKNIVEKVGDVLYVHGGISGEVNLFNFSAPVINDMARPFYGDTTYRYPDAYVEILYSDIGPFWYRGYYTGASKASQAQVDSTLSIFGAKYIATGHTIVSDTISIRFNNKLFNTDVPHSKGYSEGLLLEKGKFYRANEHGERFMIRD